MIEKIRYQLQQREFKGTQVNIPGIYIYSKVMEQELNIAVLFDFNENDKLSFEQYIHIKEQIISTFTKKCDKKVLIQTIILSNDINAVKELAIKDWEAWIVDTKNYTLVIYENQRVDFLDIRKDIEKVLASYYQNQVFESKSTKEYSSNISDVPVTVYLTKANTIMVIINILIFLLTDRLILGNKGMNLFMKGALDWYSVLYNHEYYRLITYMFLHGDVDHLVNNMMVLFFLGDSLENTVGKAKYLLIYFGTGILAGITSMGYNMINNAMIVSTGASGAIFGVVGALGYIILLNKGRVENFSKKRMILFIFLSLYGGFTSQDVDNAAHVGGLIAGIILGAVFYSMHKKKEPERGIK